MTLDRLLAARAPEAAATAWSFGGEDGVEPLCAIYEPVTLAAFLAHVSAGGGSSPRAWLESVQTHRLTQPSGVMLDGANTPAEFESVLEQARKQKDASADAANRNKNER